MLILAFAAGGLALADVKDIDRWVSGPMPAVERRKMLVHALSAPQRRVKGKVHYCFEDRWSDPALRGRVCRTLADWRRFGLDPQG